MISMMLVGAALGCVLFAVVATFRPPRRSAIVALGQFYSHYRGPEVDPEATLSRSEPAPGAQEKVGLWIATWLGSVGVSYSDLRRDLALTGQTFDGLMGKKVIAATAGFLVSLVALSALDYVGGVGFPAGTPIAIALISSAVLFLVPDVDVRHEARRRRVEFTEQLSVFLDLVSLKMAGHAAAAAALPEAAQRGGGWPMLLIRDTLFRSRLSGQDEWEALAQLGERIAVPELRDLGALVKLVADDGAQVRATLTARAASMRRARLADEEGNAEERNQSIRLAHMLIAVGFMIFVGYPAFVSIKF